MNIRKLEFERTNFYRSDNEEIIKVWIYVGDEQIDDEEISSLGEFLHLISLQFVIASNSNQELYVKIPEDFEEWVSEIEDNFRFIYYSDANIIKIESILLFED